jgi:transcriptional regulator with XRE-family HTH domain
VDDDGVEGRLLMETDAQVAYGARLRMLRRSTGMSMRAPTAQIGLSAHSNLADYECGRRLPPRDVVEACERALGVTDRQLIRHWEAALRERSQRGSGASVHFTDGTVAIARTSCRTG